MRSERRRDQRAAGQQSAASGVSDRTRTLLICTALVIAVAALYAQTAHFEFVSLDDPTYVAENPFVRAGLTWNGARWAFTAYHGGHWHPLTWLSHQLDWSLFGANAGGHHMTSAGLHACNAVLLLLTLRALTGSLWPSALVAALFAVHPLRAESVAWVSERKDVLSGTFGILTLWLFDWYTRRTTAARYLAVLVAFACGLMAKGMLVTLPLVLLLLDYWPLRRLQLPHSVLPEPRPTDQPGTAPRVSVARAIVEILPLLGLSVISSYLAVRAATSGAAVSDLTAIAPWPRIANALLSYVAYLRKAIWPSHLAINYPHPALITTSGSEWSGAPAIVAALALAVVTLAVLWRARREPYLVVGWLWFLGMLVPVSGIAQAGAQAMADRYTYLPGIGLAIMAAWGLQDVVAWRPRLRPAAIGATISALLVLSLVSWAQIGTWRSSTALYEHAVAVSDGNYLSHANLGAVLRTQGRVDDAERHLREALRIRPGEAYSHMQLGTLLQDEGKLDEAAAEQEEAVRLDPTYAQAYGNLGVVRLRQARLDEAETALRTAVRLNPGYTLAYSNLGAALLRQERWQEAATVLQQAVALDPNAADAHNNLGVALVRLGDLRAAEAQFTAALRLNPNHANAAKSLEYVRGQLGRSGS